MDAGDDQRRVAGALHAVRLVFSRPDQRRLQIAWASCVTAEGAQMVALGVYAFSALGVAGVGILGVVRTVPAAVIGPFVASAADRWPRRRVLTAALLLRAAALAGLSALIFTDTAAALVFLVAAVDAIAFSLYWPTHSALQPELADTTDELMAANAATTTMENVGALVGPAAAGVLLVAGGPPTVFVAMVVLLLSAIVVLAGAHSHTDVHVQDGVEGHGLVEGFRTLLTQSRPRLVAGLYLAQTLCLGAFGVLVVVAAFELLGIGESGVGALTAAVGAGGLIGSIGSVALVGRRRVAGALGGALLAWGGALVLVAVLVSPTAALLFLGVLGACNALVDVTALTVLQRVVAPNVLGRVLGAFEGLWWAMLGIGSVTASLLVTAAGIRTALIVVGVLLPTLALVTNRALAAIDSQDNVPWDVVSLLASVDLFTPLPPHTLERLAMMAEVRDPAAGETVIAAGETGDRYYVVASGEVVVHARSGDVHLGRGQGVGEIALLRDVPRTATVTAGTATRLYAIGRAEFLAAVRGSCPSMRAADALIARRLSPA